MAPVWAPPKEVLLKHLGKEQGACSCGYQAQESLKGERQSLPGEPHLCLGGVQLICFSCPMGHLLFRRIYAVPTRRKLFVKPMLIKPLQMG